MKWLFDLLARALFPFRKEWEQCHARNRELDQIKIQMDFWNKERVKAYEIAMKALGEGDFQTFEKARHQHTLAMLRYKKEVSDKL